MSKSLKAESRKSYRPIGKALKANRKRGGYSQKEIAKKLKITFQQVQKYESGKNRIPLDRFATLCDLYGFPQVRKAIEEFVRSI